MAAFSNAQDAVRKTLTIPRFLTTGLMDLVLPPACRFCEGPLSTEVDTNAQARVRSNWDNGAKCQAGSTNSLPHFCADCLRVLSVSEPMMREACKRCGMPPAGISPRPDAEEPTASHTNEPNSTNFYCQSCRDQQFHFDAVIALWMYRDRVCEAIVASKYGHNVSLADALGHRLGDRLWKDLSSHPPSDVTFVPSHLFRQISRGGIGARAIAQAVATHLNIPLSSRLKAIRPIHKQAWLDDEDRKQNVHGAFAARKSYAFGRSPKLDDQHILLVDDVLTTGATANELARVLKDSGAARVTVAVVSRAVRTR